MTGQADHYYHSGVFHDTPPGEAIGCCDRPRDEHPERPLPRTCTCSNVLNGLPHFWSTAFGCPA